MSLVADSLPYFFCHCDVGKQNFVYLKPACEHAHVVIVRSALKPWVIFMPEIINKQIRMINYMDVGNNKR